MLELQNVQKSFGDAKVLNGISLTVNDGEIVSILGPSGSGKTTLLNLILGITDLTGGKLLYNGKDLSNTRWSSAALTLYSRIMRCSPT